MIKQFQLTGKMLLDSESVLSIPNPYANGSFPYWISHPDGATIKKVKVMLGRVTAGHSAGSITIELYAADSATTSSDNSIASSPNSGLSADYIRGHWGKMGEIDMTFSDDALLYPTEYKVTNIKINNPHFVIGLVDVAGDIQVVNAFMWVEYEDNEQV
jgi:hypothetical protein